MKRPLHARRLVVIAALVAAWCALWGEATLANIASGAALATLVSGRVTGNASRGRIGLGPLLRFGALVAADLVMATIGVAREILTPTDRTDEAIIAVPVPTDSRSHLLLLVIAVTLTPGTAVVDVDADGGTLYLHLLPGERRAATTAHVTRLAELAGHALPTDSSRHLELRR